MHGSPELTSGDKVTIVPDASKTDDAKDATSTAPARQASAGSSGTGG